MMDGRVIANRRLLKGHFLMSLKLPGSFKKPIPGQFLMVRIKGRNEPFLGRPFSVYSFAQDGRGVYVEILYKIVGKGTMCLSGQKKGALLEIHGPYGTPFDMDKYPRNVILVSGGIGVAPVTYLASQYRHYLPAAPHLEMVCYHGVTGSRRLLGLERLKEFCSDVFISSDDGTVGYHGSVVEMFEKDVLSYNPEDTMIYACGPRPMLKKLAGLGEVPRFRCQALLEEHMACGLGACLGCAIRVRDGEGRGAYRRVCTDGPVFNIQDIEWDY